MKKLLLGSVLGLVFSQGVLASDRVDRDRFKEYLPLHAPHMVCVSFYRDLELYSDKNRAAEGYYVSASTSADMQCFPRSDDRYVDVGKYQRLERELKKLKAQFSAEG